MSWRKNCLGALVSRLPEQNSAPTLAIKIIKKGNEYKKGQGQLQEEEVRKKEGGKGAVNGAHSTRLHMSTTAPHPSQFTFGFWGLREPPHEMSTKLPTKELQIGCKP